MTPLAAALARAGWSATTLAARMGIGERRAQHYASGRYSTPAEVLAYAEAIARAVEAAHIREMGR